MNHIELSVNRNQKVVGGREAKFQKAEHGSPLRIKFYEYRGITLTS